MNEFVKITFLLILFLVIGPLCLNSKELEPLGILIALIGTGLLVFRIVRFAIYGFLKTCPDCQKAIGSEAKVCPYCQHRFNQNPPAENLPESEKDKTAEYDPFGFNAPVDKSKKSYHDEDLKW